MPMMALSSDGRPKTISTSAMGTSNRPRFLKTKSFHERVVCSAGIVCQQIAERAPQLDFRLPADFALDAPGISDQQRRLRRSQERVLRSCPLHTLYTAPDWPRSANAR